MSDLKDVFSDVFDAKFMKMVQGIISKFQTETIAELSWSEHQIGNNLINATAAFRVKSLVTNFVMPESRGYSNNADSCWARARW